MMRVLPTALLLTALVVSARVGSCQDLQKSLEGGEFGVVSRIAESLPADERDQVLAQVAAAQGAAGDLLGAASTIGNIGGAGVRGDVIGGVAGVGGAGGGAFADFQSLIQLIQQTVAPDAWEEMGGASTMIEYAQGVYVDPSGTLREAATVAKSDSLGRLKSLLEQADGDRPWNAEDWKRPSALRFVSLRRLLEQRTLHQLRATALPESITNLAGISRIQYLFLTDDDIVLAGPVGGITEVEGWLRDRETGRTPIRLDFLTTCLRSAIAGGSFGCTIDPTTEGLQRAVAVADAVNGDRLPIGKASQTLAEALGKQRIEVFGTPGDTTVGYVMVEADRHMKQLALGTEPMPDGVKNYLDFVAEYIQRGPPKDLLLRLWFTSKPRDVRSDNDQTVFEISGTPIRLSGQNERAVASGARGNLTRDFRTDAFVEEFNRHWHEIYDEYPIYSSLESVFDAASIAELVNRYADAPSHRQIVDALALEGSYPGFRQRTPTQVQSIATLRTIRNGRKRHHVLIASGGVAVSPSRTLNAELVSYPSLGQLQRPQRSRPAVVQRWWWDR